MSFKIFTTAAAAAFAVTCSASARPPTEPADLFGGQLNPPRFGSVGDTVFSPDSRTPSTPPGTGNDPVSTPLPGPGLLTGVGLLAVAARRPRRAR